MTRNVPKALAALLMVGVIGANAAASDGILDKPISLNLKKAAVDELPPLFARLLGATARIEFTSDERISLTFENVTARTSLNAFCESAGCGWEWIDGDPPTLRFFQTGENGPERAIIGRKDTPPAEVRVTKRVSLDLRGADAGEVFRLAARILGIEATLDPRLADRKLSIEREDRPMSEVLDEMCARAGCRWRLTDDAPPKLEITADDGT